MNPFEELCKLASSENWCWKLSCTTCAHMHFRYAFLELASGKSPTGSDWIVHNKNTTYSSLLGLMPSTYSEKQKQEITVICSNAKLWSIANVCKFPDWLGYLGLILKHMYSDNKCYLKLSVSWASQLSELIPKELAVQQRLAKVINGRDLLSIQDLEHCESSIRTTKDWHHS